MLLFQHLILDPVAAALSLIYNSCARWEAMALIYLLLLIPVVNKGKDVNYNSLIPLVSLGLRLQT